METPFDTIKRIIRDNRKTAIKRVNLLFESGYLTNETIVKWNTSIAHRAAINYCLGSNSASVDCWSIAFLNYVVTPSAPKPKTNIAASHDAMICAGHLTEATNLCCTYAQRAAQSSIECKGRSWSDTVKDGRKTAEKEAVEQLNDLRFILDINI